MKNGKGFGSIGLMAKAMMSLVGVLAFSVGMVDKNAHAVDIGTVYRKVLFVGDSITSHGPAAHLGWSGNWGMAASSEDKDYVHLFLARLVQSQNGVQPETIIGGGGGGKLTSKQTELPKYKAFAADMAVIQMGENDNTDVTVDGFQKPYERIIESIRAGNPNARVFCFAVFGGSAQKDAMIQDACKRFNATFVSLKELNANPLNRAGSENRFTNKGVNWHPGDRGMQAYADALWAAFSGKAVTPPQETKAESSQSALLFAEKWDGASGQKWDLKPNVEKLGDKSVLSVTAKEPGKQLFYSVNLPMEMIKGRQLVVETRVKGESISEKPKKWNGIRIGLKTDNAEGQINYPQLHLNVGTFDWTEVKWTYRVPDNVIAAKLQIGLANVTGTVYFDALKVSVE